LFRSPAVAGRVEDAARVDSPGDQLFHRPFDLDALPHAPGPEEEIQPVRLDVGQDVGSIDERRRGDVSEVAVAACPVRVAPPEVRCRELLFDLAGLHGPAPRKSIPFRRTVRKKVYVFAVSSSRKYTFLPLTPRWGAHGRAAGATSSPANERCATPQRNRGAFPDRNGRAAALGSELAADPGSWGRPDESKRTASLAERVRVYRAGGDCGTITFWPIPRFRPHLVVAHTLARAERAAL